MAEMSQTGLLLVGNDLQTALLLTTKVALFKEGFTPTRASTKADFDAQQCDFSNYTAGGKVCGAGFNNPYFNRAGDGVLVTAPSLQWEYDDGGDPGVSNVVAGYYIYDAANHLLSYELFDQTVPMSALGDACTVIPTIPIGGSA